jgi:hypothetical protein
VSGDWELSWLRAKYGGLWEISRTDGGTLVAKNPDTGQVILEDSAAAMDLRLRPPRPAPPVPSGGLWEGSST